MSFPTTVSSKDIVTVNSSAFLLVLCLDVKELISTPLDEGGLSVTVISYNHKDILI